VLRQGLDDFVNPEVIRLWLSGLNHVPRSMRSVLAIVTMLALTGCSDEVTTRFPHLSDAKAQGALERGWLPPLLPASARAIVERNHLDSNTGTGSFAYDLPERPSYREKLSRAGGVTRVEGDSDILTVTTHGSQWEIRLPRTSGSAEWRIRPR
jgi:hypothetical protein